MKLLLHIGTHKTATSSLQSFLRKNKTVLESQGIYYPIPPGEKKNFNNFANKLATGSSQETIKTFQEVYRAASKKGLHHVIISAESFYAMTNFFGNHLNEDIDSYFLNERKLIKKLEKACSPFKEVKIVCYFKPQDEFASSIYNQEIKGTFGISGSYLDYLKLRPELFNYNSHIKLIEEYFGQENIKCINFDGVKKDFIKNFCQEFLPPTFYALASDYNHIVNERLNRKCLEYKRVFNKLIKDKSLHFIAEIALKEMSLAEPDKKKDHVYGSFRDREAYFSKYELENEELCKRYNIDIIPTIVAKEYDNSSIHFVNKKYAMSTSSISLYLRKWIKQPNKLINFYIRKVIYYIIKIFPELKNFFLIIKSLKKKFKHKFRID